jgi:hypothetical protein
MIEHLTHLISYFALSCSGVPENLDVSIYRTIDAQAIYTGNQVAFSRKMRKFVMTFSASIDDPDWSHELGGLYEVRTVNGILFDVGTEMSIPRDVLGVRQWAINGWDCHSAQLDKGLRVFCSFSDNKVERLVRYKVYDYDPARGVTAFSMPCQQNRTCWYFLKSGPGILLAN